MYEQPVLMPGLLFSVLYYVVALSTLVVANSFRKSTQEVDALEGVDGGSASASSQLPWRAGAELGGYLFLGNFFQVLGLQWTTADRAAFIVQLTTVIVPVLESVSSRIRFGAAAKPLPTRVWAACALAAAGVVVISADGAGYNLAEAAANLLAHRESKEAVGASVTAAVATATSTQSSAAAAAAAAIPETAAATAAATAVATAAEAGVAAALSLRGDALVAVSAVLYSFHVLRLGSLAPEAPPLKLAQTKAAFETFYSVLTLGALALLPALLHASPLALDLDWLPNHFSPAADLNAFVGAAQEGSVGEAEWAAIGWAGLWCGAMTCAYTIWAQSFGQREVRPVEANLIYTMQPLFSALFAAALLGETMSPQAEAGGLVVVLALLVCLGPQKTLGPLREE
jgi:drug/metabolite transporter (DMT)-like permease